MGEDRWQKLEVWKIADDFAFQVYRATKDFPREELFGLTSQLRRAVLSVPTNIVEGYSRRGDKELAHFLDIAIGSLEESKYLLHFSNRLGYLSKSDYDDLYTRGFNLAGKLWKFYQKVKKDV